MQTFNLKDLSYGIWYDLNLVHNQLDNFVKQYDILVCQPHILIFQHHMFIAILIAVKKL